MRSLLDRGETFDTHVPLLIVGAGAAGLCAALAAKEAGVDAVVVERDAVPSGSTALSAGLIPAAGTRFQRAKGIADSPAVFAADIQRKAQRRSRSGRGRGRCARCRAAGRMAGRSLRAALRRGRQFQLSRPFGHAHARPAEPDRPGTDRSPAQAAEASDIVILTRSVGETHLWRIRMARSAASRSFAATAPAKASVAMR